IAFHARRCQSRQARTPESRFLYLAAAVEGLVRYLGLVAFSDYLQQGAFETRLNAWLQEHLSRPLTLGTWLELLRETMRSFISQKRTLRLPASHGGREPGLGG